MTRIAFHPAELVGLRLPAGRGCDFCASDPPAWRYPARTAGLGAIVHADTIVRPVSLGAWDSCTGCAAHIEGGDWPGLARRSLRSLNLDFSRAGPGLRVRFLAQIRSAHAAFRGARQGPRGRL